MSEFDKKIVTVYNKELNVMRYARPAVQDGVYELADNASFRDASAINVDSPEASGYMICKAWDETSVSLPEYHKLIKEAKQLAQEIEAMLDGPLLKVMESPHFVEVYKRLQDIMNRITPKSHRNLGAPER